MNSFNTHTATLAAVTTAEACPAAALFLQHKFPKILQGELDAGQLAAPTASWSGTRPATGMFTPRFSPPECFRNFWTRACATPSSATRTTWGPASTRPCSAISPKSDFPS
ncbi:MAG: hypothetical protein MZV70_56240 [Desulfobacterales bacterium]|nr:hypothetical protein [Desulfobacterales bacterium]